MSTTPPTTEGDAPKLTKCAGCYQFRMCAAVGDKWYCKARCEVRARRGTLSKR